MPNSRALLYLLGSKSAYFTEMSEIALAAGWTNVVGLDNLSPGYEKGLRHRGTSPWLRAVEQSFFLTCPGKPSIRKSLADLGTQLGLSPAPALIHPSASVSPSASLGGASSINRLAAIGANSRVGRHCQINRSASVGHDCNISDFVSVGPGAVLAGSIQIGVGAFIGAGAVVLPGLTIGTGAVIGAGAVVTKSVEDSAVMVGNPARNIDRAL